MPKLIEGLRALFRRWRLGDDRSYKKLLHSMCLRLIYKDAAFYRQHIRMAQACDRAAASEEWQHPQRDPRLLTHPPTLTQEDVSRLRRRAEMTIKARGQASPNVAGSGETMKLASGLGKPDC